MDYEAVMKEVIERMHSEFAEASNRKTKHGTVMYHGEERNVYCHCDGIRWNSSKHSCDVFVPCCPDCGIYPGIFKDKSKEPGNVPVDMQNLKVGDRVRIARKFKGKKPTLYAESLHGKHIGEEGKIVGIRTDPHIRYSMDFATNVWWMPEALDYLGGSDE